MVQSWRNISSAILSAVAANGAHFIPHVPLNLMRVFFTCSYKVEFRMIHVFQIAHIQGTGLRGR